MRRCVQRPSPEHTPEERVNAVVRLLAYGTAAAALVQATALPLVYGAVSVAAMSGAHAASAAATTAPRRRRKGRGAATQACTRSTPDNPFANPLPGDPLDKPPACASEDAVDLARANFNRGLPRDLFDVYERQNNQHQFGTVPVTDIVDDRRKFVEFCYGGGQRAGCKENPAKCTGLR